MGVGKLCIERVVLQTFFRSIKRLVGERTWETGPNAIMDISCGLEKLPTQMNTRNSVSHLGKQF